jgi:hypothetical protein
MVIGILRIVVGGIWARLEKEHAKDAEPYIS